MPSPTTAIYDYIVRELAPSEHDANEAPITIVCEPFDAPVGSAPSARLSIRLKPGTTLDEAHAMASTLQAKVKGLCQLVASDDAEA